MVMAYKFYDSPRYAIVVEHNPAELYVRVIYKVDRSEVGERFCTIDRGDGYFIVRESDGLTMEVPKCADIRRLAVCLTVQRMSKGHGFYGDSELWSFAGESCRAWQDPCAERPREHKPGFYKSMRYCPG